MSHVHPNESVHRGAQRVHFGLAYGGWLHGICDMHARQYIRHTRHHGAVDPAGMQSVPAVTKMQLLQKLS
jgi:hypothetical protein